MEIKKRVEEFDDETIGLMVSAYIDLYHSVHKISLDFEVQERNLKEYLKEIGLIRRRGGITGKKVVNTYRM